MRALAWLVAALTALRIASLVATATPEATYLYPAGGPRGGAVQVSVGGALPDWPVGAWSSSPGVSVAPLEEKGKLEIKIDADASVGLIWLRLYDRQGAALPRPWVVGFAPEAAEVEPNDQPASAQPVAHEAETSQTITVNGRLQSEGDVDVYLLTARAGQTLVADLDAQAELASPFDGVLQILRPDGSVAAHNDDHRQLDPRLALPLTSDGKWMVRVFGFPEVPGQDIQLAGNEAYVYRLTLSTGPVVNYALPLAARRGQVNRWQLAGWNLTPDVGEISLTPPDDRRTLVLHNDRLGRTISVPIVECSVHVESEPNSLAEPTKIDLPASITGRMDGPADRDAFQVDAVKGETLLIGVESRALGHPLDPVLELYDGADKRLARIDDLGANPDAQISHAVQEDGPLRVVVTDLHGRGGLEFVYRLSIERATPSFRLSTELHQVVVKGGETAEVSIGIQREHGFGEPIDVAVESLPDGVEASSQTSKVGEGSETADKVVLSFSAASHAAAASAPIRIVGTSESASSAAHFATPGHPQCPADIWLTVIPAE